MKSSTSHNNLISENNERIIDENLLINLSEKELEGYYSYMNLKVYSNIKLSFKIFFLMSLIYITSRFFYYLEIPKEISLILIIQGIIIKIILFTNNKKLSKYLDILNDYPGHIIYLSSNTLRIIYYFMTAEDASGQGLSYFMPRWNTQVNNFMGLSFFVKYKQAVYVEIFQKILYLLAKYVIFKMYDHSEVMDLTQSAIVFIALAYSNDQMNKQFFFSYSKNLKSALLQISAGFDKISENLLIVSIKDNHNLSAYHCSQNFLSKYYKGIHLTEDVISSSNNSNKTKIVKSSKGNHNRKESCSSNLSPTNPLILKSKEYLKNSKKIDHSDDEKSNDKDIKIDHLFKHFLFSPDSANNKNKENMLELNSYEKMVQEHTLLDDLRNLILENKYFNDKHNSNSNNKANVYTYLENNHFEVRYVICNLTTLGEHQSYFLMMFKNLDKDTFDSKREQITAFSSKVINLFSKDLKNKLYQMYSEINIIKNITKDNLLKHKEMAKDINVLSSELNKIRSKNCNYNFSTSNNKNNLIANLKNKFSSLENILIENSEMKPLSSDHLKQKISNMDSNNFVFSYNTITRNSSNGSDITKCISEMSGNLKQYMKLDLLILKNVQQVKTQKIKIEFLIKNYEFYAHNNKTSILNIRTDNYNLNFLILKSLKFIDERLILQLNLDIALASQIVIKTDYNLFLILFMNLLTLHEQFDNIPSIAVNVELERDERIESETFGKFLLKIKFTTSFIIKNCNYTNGDNNDNNSEFDFFKMISLNNKNICNYLSYNYKEDYNNEQQSNSEFEITIFDYAVSESFSPDKNNLYYSITDEYKNLAIKKSIKYQGFDQFLEAEEEDNEDSNINKLNSSHDCISHIESNHNRIDKLISNASDAIKSNHGLILPKRTNSMISAKSFMSKDAKVIKPRSMFSNKNLTKTNINYINNNINRNNSNNSRKNNNPNNLSINIQNTFNINGNNNNNNNSYGLINESVYNINSVRHFSDVIGSGNAIEQILPLTNTPNKNHFKHNSKSKKGIKENSKIKSPDLNKSSSSSNSIEEIFNIKSYKLNSFDKEDLIEYKSEKEEVVSINETESEGEELKSKKLLFDVLIVDDDSLSRNYLSNMVRTFGKTLETAADGQEAVDKIKELINTKTYNNCNKTFHNKLNSHNTLELLILMDIHMPILNGIEATKQIDQLILDFNELNMKNNNINKNLINCRLFFISANLETQFMGILETFKVYNGYLNKPVPKKQLFKILENEDKNK